MQDNKSDHKSDHRVRRTVSLDPKMTSPEEKTSTELYVNPLYEDQSQKSSDERNSSVRRQQSEPARNRWATMKTNAVSRTESLKSMVKKQTADFFCVNDDNNSQNQKWQQRRMRLLSNYSKLKTKEQPLSKLRTKALTTDTNEATGFDETDGVLNNNAMTGFSENVSHYVQELSPELNETSRKPALKITLKALAMASTAIKRKVSTRTDQEIPRRTVSEQQTEQQSDLSGSVATDSVFDSSDELIGDDDFFKKPSISPIEEVDYNLRKMGDIAYYDNKWTLRRQMSVKAKGIPEQIVNAFLDNSNRRKYGLGFVGRLLDRKLKKDLTNEERKAIDHIDDYRPFFTYWITTVQILILVISLIAYGFGHFGFGSSHVNGLVLVTSLSLQQVDYYEHENFWFGPRAADLIHLGAKFTPCMRKDLKTFEIINEERNREKITGCCIRNDGSGCVQSSKHNCSPLLSTWHKWNNNTNRELNHLIALRSSGPVCGQDPRYCEQPASTGSYQWPDDITKWPICLKKGIERPHEDHMKCELIGRPCCLGIYGQCHITTREYCDFAKGFFHEEATLCSQVSCMENVCGMIPFYSKDTPDQFYRIWTPIFLHAGLGHLAITVVFQYFIMRDIEKLAGPARIAIIYLVSGIGGYLASATFVPFRAEVGPAGSQFGILACLFIEVINSWSFLENPLIALIKLIIPTVFLLAFGFLPWIDNYAHTFGFIIGFLLSYALLPYVTVKEYSNTSKISQIIFCLTTVAIIIITLFVILYKVPIYDCPFCKYLNCVPLTSDWCANQDIQINRVDIL